MNAMLEARVVAASTQRPEAFEHGAAAGRERIMLASQGSWINAGMMVACHRPDHLLICTALNSIFRKSVIRIAIEPALTHLR
jgi:hypothetical protein